MTTNYRFYTFTENLQPYTYDFHDNIKRQETLTALLDRHQLREDTAELNWQTSQQHTCQTANAGTPVNWWCQSSIQNIIYHVRNYTISPAPRKRVILRFYPDTHLRSLANTSLKRIRMRFYPDGHVQDIITARKRVHMHFYPDTHLRLTPQRMKRIVLAFYPDNNARTLPGTTMKRILLQWGYTNRPISRTYETESPSFIENFVNWFPFWQVNRKRRR